MPESRRVGRMAVNEVRALFERHGHIVQEVDGGNDHGEDLHVTFVQNGERTADSIPCRLKVESRRVPERAIASESGTTGATGVTVVCRCSA